MSRERSGVPPGGPGRVERPFRRVGRGSADRESMGGSTRWPEKADRPFRKAREELAVSPRRPGQVDRPSRRTRRGWEALPKSQERSGGSCRGMGGIGRPCRRAGKCTEAILEVREWLGGPPRGPGGVGMLSRGTRWVRSPPRRVRKRREALSKGQERAGGVGRLLWMAGRRGEAFK